MSTHIETSSPPKATHIHKPGKRLGGWGLPIYVRQLEGIQKKHDILRDLVFLHHCLEMTSWYEGRQHAPITADGTEGDALYRYSLQCGAQVAFWVPKMSDSDGKFAVYMAGDPDKQAIAGSQCDHVLTEILRAMGG